MQEPNAAGKRDGPIRTLATSDEPVPGARSSGTALTTADAAP